MKSIKKTLMASFLACAAFNAQAEVSPWGYGIKAGAGTSSAVSHSEAKINDKAIKGNFLDTVCGFGNLYAEYAFTDYIGAKIEGGYLRQGASLKAGEGDTDPSISMVSHGIAVPLQLCIYPMGREEEEGILKVMLGATMHMPLKLTCKADNNELSLDDKQKKECSGLDLAGALGVGYELPFGLSMEAKYNYGFLNKFKIENKNDQSIYQNVQGLKELHVQHLTVGVGYNFASLLGE